MLRKGVCIVQYVKAEIQFHVTTVGTWLNRMCMQ